MTKDSIEVRDSRRDVRADRRRRATNGCSIYRDLQARGSRWNVRGYQRGATEGLLGGRGRSAVEPPGKLPILVAGSSTLCRLSKTSATTTVQPGARNEFQGIG